MVACPGCASRLTAPAYRCARCDFRPQTLRGFPSWAPGLADQNDGFHEADFAGTGANRRPPLLVPCSQRADSVGASYLHAEAWVAAGDRVRHGLRAGRHREGIPWCAARRHRDLRGRIGGCGQADSRGRAHANGCPSAAVRRRVRCRRSPGRHRAREEDEAVLCQMHRAVKKTLADRADFGTAAHVVVGPRREEEACHKRRYVVGELERKSARAGFRVVRSTSFVTLLLPLLLLTRLLDRRRGRSGGPESCACIPWSTACSRPCSAWNGPAFGLASRCRLAARVWWFCRRREAERGHLICSERFYRERSFTAARVSRSTSRRRMVSRLS